MANRDLARLLGMVSIPQHEMSPFLVMARNRAMTDPEGFADARCFQAMEQAAVSRGHRTSPGVFNQLARMSSDGELERLLSGQASPTLTRAVGRKMHRLGKAEFDIDEPVLHKSDPERGRGMVVDYVTDGGKYLVQWDAFQITEESAGDLVKTAIVAPPPVAGAAARDIVRELARSKFRAPPADPFREFVASQSGGRRALELARSALAECGLAITQEIRLIGMADNPYANPPDSERQARVLVRAKSPTGARLELEVPVRIVGETPERPTQFRFGGRTYALTPDSIGGLLRYYAIQPHPHQNRQFSSHPLTTSMPVPGNGQFSIENLPTVRFASTAA